MEESGSNSIDSLCGGIVASIFDLSEHITRVHVCITKQRTPFSSGTFSYVLTKDKAP